MTDLAIGPQLDLVPVERPNGKVYRPRRLPRAVQVENRDDVYGPSGWLYVLGTHDVDRATRLAEGHWEQVDLATAKQAWMRLTMRGGDHVYESDPVRTRVRRADELSKLDAVGGSVETPEAGR